MRLGLLESVTQLNSHALHLRVALFLLYLNLNIERDGFTQGIITILCRAAKIGREG